MDVSIINNMRIINLLLPKSLIYYKLINVLYLFYFLD